MGASSAFYDWLVRTGLLDVWRTAADTENDFLLARIRRRWATSTPRRQRVGLVA